ncbi:succinylglutamate desuccinylase/aspartoacylase domain-containing protein [Marinobacterium litorale]|uniref:succinylglutamate desuccinylase/aspartoacylase domain-containing protein n=1 Tax=Marinobacterium litorale TaxID=404770 RepID=UPI00041784CF|nr:succinylglutamate desuccinylase/aspartoacylase family protein [Marinobacterium litorale]
MTTENDPIRIIEAPSSASWASDAAAFLEQLGGAAMIIVPGRDRSRTRAVCTLLHGNEPSGLRALHRFLRSGHQPAVNLICFIPAVETALHEQLHQHRYLPGERDMNRCFLPPYNDRPGRIAERLLQLIAAFRPECLVDIHNTSGAGPAFGVVAHEDEQHEALVSLFTKHLVVTDIRLGALMEMSRPEMPIVTVECGGAGDTRADRVAFEGLMRYVDDDQVLKLARGTHLEIYHTPARLELIDDAQLAFATRPVPGADLTVPPDLERFNFGTAPAGTFIGWLAPGEAPAQKLRARSGSGVDRFTELFRIDQGRLVTAQPLKLFMITHRPDIAKSDCLLYAAPESGHSRL